jgi:hypothetical protein
LTGLVQGARLFEKGVALRRDRDRAIEMRQGGVEIPIGAGDARGQKMRRGIAGPPGQAGFDVLARGLNFVAGEQHGGEKMMQHRFAGRAGEPLFAEPARLVRPAGIKGRRGATNDALGVGLIHAAQIRATGSRRKEGGPHKV